MPRRHPDRRGHARRTIAAKVAAPPVAPPAAQEPTVRPHQHQQPCGCRTGSWYCPPHWADLSEAERVAHRGDFGGRGGAR